MTRWVYAPIETSCGGAAHTAQAPRLIAKGELMQERLIAGTRRRIVRCVDCAPPPGSSTAIVDHSVASATEQRIDRSVSMATSKGGTSSGKA